MSVTGPGCEHCNKGLVNWQGQPYERARDWLDYKPCDHCGGLSQLAATEFPGTSNCPTCGGLTLCLVCNDRVKRADAIVRALAEWPSSDDDSLRELDGLYQLAVAYAKEPTP